LTARDSASAVHHIRMHAICPLQIHPAGVTFQEPPATSTPTKPAVSQPAAAAAAAGRLLPAATSQGPIITTSPEESAQAQQALDLLNSYDFKIYVSGRAFDLPRVFAYYCRPGKRVIVSEKVACELRVAALYAVSHDATCIKPNSYDFKIHVNGWQVAVFHCWLVLRTQSNRAARCIALHALPRRALARNRHTALCRTRSQQCVAVAATMLCSITSQGQGMMAGATAVPLTPPYADIASLLLPCSFQTHRRVKA
jgi:hypothetical protein